MIEDAVIRCDVCSARSVVKPFDQEHLDAFSGTTTARFRVPEGWKVSFGDSGKRCFHRCPNKACQLSFEQGGTGID